MLINLIKIKCSKVSILLLSIFCFLSITRCSNKTKDLYSSLTAEQIYYQGKEYIKNKKYSDAVKAFEALEAEYPYGDYADKAKLSLIYSYYFKGDLPQVKAVAERLLKMYPNHRYADYVHYMQGVASYDQYYSTVYKVFNIDRSKRENSLAIESFDAFKILLERFPKSKYALDARNRMFNLRNQIAFNELHIAEYYFKREAYLSAANRANYIINNFNGSLAVPGALQLMINSYNKLNMPEFERNAINLMNNFKALNSETDSESKK